MEKTELAVVSGSKSPKGWHLSVNINGVVDCLCTPTERAMLLEKIACTASAEASTIRQNISANQSD